jgi:8-oxo-dGTP diphosphatase
VIKIKQQIGVKAIITNNNNEILLVKRSDKYNEIKNYWDIPGGRIDFGEEPLDGLKRELLEEINLELDQVKKIIDASTVYKDDNKHIIRITYLCTVKNTNIQISDEHTEFLWINSKDIDFDLKDHLLKKCIKIL